MQRSFISVFVLLMALTLPLHAQQVIPIPWMTFAPWPDNGDFSQFSPDQYIFLDSQKAEWVAYYPEDMGNPEFSRRVELRFGNPAEVRPVILSHVERLADGTYSYTYVLQNGPRARLPIESWRIAVAADDERFQASHPGWDVAHIRSGTTLGFPGPFGLKWYEWTARGPQGLIPPRNGVLGQFTIRSASAPGFTEFWATGKVNREYSADILATLPQPVAGQLAELMENLARGRGDVTLAPWIPAGTPLSTVVRNFQYGLSVVTGHGRGHGLIDPSSPFVRETRAALDGYFESGESATFFNPNTMGFLSLAAPGLETEIANALRLSLTRE